MVYSQWMAWHFPTDGRQKRQHTSLSHVCCLELCDGQHGHRHQHDGRKHVITAATLTHTVLTMMSIFTVMGKHPLSSLLTREPRMLFWVVGPEDLSTWTHVALRVFLPREYCLHGDSACPLESGGLSLNPTSAM